MRRSVIVSVFFVLAVSGGVVWSTLGYAASSPEAAASSQRVAGGGVMVTAGLLNDQPENTAIRLALDTHSVNLDGYAFDVLAILRDETGKTYPVTAVEDARGGGHHRQAVLRFSKVAPEAKMIELVVKDVAGIKERTFQWKTAE